MSEWQPIETAPKDREILAFDQQIGVAIIRWDYTWVAWFDGRMVVDGYGDPEYFTPTHWMPLPLPPISDHQTGLPASSTE